MKTYLVPEYKGKSIVEVDAIASLGFLCVVHRRPHPILTHMLLDARLRSWRSIRNGANYCCGLC